jgi:hypothetical protein
MPALRLVNSRAFLGVAPADLVAFGQLLDECVQPQVGGRFALASRAARLQACFSASTDLSSRVVTCSV